MKNIKLKVKFKNKKGSNYNKKNRKKNIIPGIIYGNKKKNIPILIKHDDLYNKIKKYQENNKKIYFTLKLNKKKILSKIKYIQMHKYKNKIIHIDFIYK